MELDPQRRRSSSAADDQGRNVSNGGGGDHERTSSMEKEPRTLNYNHIHFAREAALYVVKTRTHEEAMSIFTQGMERVDEGRWSSASGGDQVDIISHERRTGIEDGEEEEELDDDCNIFRVSGGVKRDVATAPF